MYYASLYENTNKSENYRLYLSADVMRLIPDVEWVKMFKHKGHIVIAPVRDDFPERRHLIYRQDRKFGQISLNRLVTDGTIPKRYFGNKYKVKKDKMRNIYVCLDEPIGGDADNAAAL